MAPRILSQRQVKQKAASYLRHLHADRRLPITAAYLYGSYASGKPHVYSDIDLCIISSKFRDPYTALASLWQWRRPEDTGIEPVGFHPRDFNKDLPLVSQIRKTGKRISWQ